MRDELLVPLSRPSITTAIQQFQRNAMNATSFNMNTKNNDHHQYHHHHHHHQYRQDDIGGGGLQRALLGIANDIYYDTMLRGTTLL
jgi:hypothetical protein